MRRPRPAPLRPAHPRCRVSPRQADRRPRLRGELRGQPRGHPSAGHLRLGESRVPLPERIYAAAVTMATAGWIAAATAIGPRSPASAGRHAARRPNGRDALVGAPAPAGQGPGRTKARCLARDQSGDRPGRVAGHVRRRRRLGWTARFALPRGQTIADVIARLPAIESALGTNRGAVRAYPTPDDLANRFELRVLDRSDTGDRGAYEDPRRRMLGF